MAFEEPFETHLIGSFLSLSSLFLESIRSFVSVFHRRYLIMRGQPHVSDLLIVARTDRVWISLIEHLYGGILLFPTMDDNMC